MKKGKKLLFVFSFFLIALIFLSVIMSADSSNLIQDQKNQKNNETDSSLSGLSENVYNYIKEFTSNNKIDSKEIKNVSKLDMNSLPKDVDLKNVNDANLAIYQIEYSPNNSEQNKKVYMITYSTDKLEKQSDLIISEDKRSLLNFGINKKINESQFMESATGIVGSLNKGYVMMRKGSITGISTSLESLGGDGSVEIIVYKNGNKINFGNEFVISQEGTKKDYDIQSKGITEFEAGDVLSLYVKISGNVSIKDVNTLLEIITE
jgi:hypothetical protein